MATFTITTDVNFDTLTGAAGGDTYLINGGKLTIDTDTRFCANHTTTTGRVGHVTIHDTIGGELNVDGTNVRIIPFDSGADTVPPIGTTITQGGVTGYLLGVWTAINVDATAVGDAMPATGYIKIKNKSGGDFASGALTGITANATGPDRLGWIVFYFLSASYFLKNGTNGTLNINGGWFELGVTDGNRHQLVIVPDYTNKGGGVWIETAPDSDVYEQYVYTSAGFATDSRGKVVFPDGSTGFRVGGNGTTGYGYLPPAGCKIRVPNVICTHGSNPSSFGNFNAYYLGINNINYCSSSFDIGNSNMTKKLTMTHCTFSSNMNAIASQTDGAYVDDVIYSQNRQVLRCTNSTFKNVYIITGETAPCNIVGNTNCDFENFLVTLNAGRTTTAYRTYYVYANTDCDFINFTSIGHRMNFVSNENCLVKDFKYADGINGGVNTGVPGRGIVGEANMPNINCVFDGFRLFTDSMSHPKDALFYFSSASNSLRYVTFKNIGTLESPFNCGTTSPVAYIINLGSSFDNTAIKIQNVHAINAQSGIYALSQSTAFSGLICENISDTKTTDGLRLLYGTSGIFRNNYLPNVSPTSSMSIGSLTMTSNLQFFNYFYSLTQGLFIFNTQQPSGNNLSAVETSFTMGSGFTGGGSVALVNVGDYYIYTTPYRVVGHTGFQNLAPILTGTLTGNLALSYDIDKGSGFSGTFTELTAANLSAESGIDPVAGFVFKLKAICVTAHPTNVLMIVKVYTTTDSTNIKNMYPQELVPLMVTGLAENSEVRCYVGSVDSPASAVEIGGTESSGTSFTMEHEYGGQDGYIRIHALGYQSITLPITYPTIESSIPIQQQIDRQYNNP